MAISSNGTKLTNLVNPQVLSDMISAVLPNAIRFLPLADVNYDLKGRPGDTLTVPKYAYIGDATDVAEGADIPISKLTTSNTTVTIKKAGKAVEITDEAVLSGYGRPVDEAANQLGMAISNKVDNDMLTSVASATLTSSVATAGKFTIDDLFEAKAKFGEKIDDPTVLVINSKYYAKLAASIVALEHTDKVLINGVVGKLAGVQVAVSDKLVAVSSVTPAYLIQPGALGLLLKRDILVESDRDIIAKYTVISADEHYATYLKDATKAVKISI